MTQEHSAGPWHTTTRDRHNRRIDLKVHILDETGRATDLVVLRVGKLPIAVMTERELAQHITNCQNARTALLRRAAARAHQARA